MKIYNLNTKEYVPHESFSSAAEQTVITLGNFDGIHVGHRQLLKTAAAEAAQRGMSSVVWTFAESPKTTLSPSDNILVITSEEEKLRLFTEHGLDYAIFEDFSAVRNLTPTEFVKTILIDSLGCVSAIAGFNFKFGAMGTGDADTLANIMTAEKLSATVIPPVFKLNKIVSSSAIRLMIADGAMEDAETFLGRPFSINFPVVYGKQLGRTIGIPTVNQNFPEGHIIPKTGIYACTCEVGDDIFLGVANVGRRPTVTNEGGINCETHIINYNGWLYGKRIKVNFHRRLRDEVKFPNVDELKKAIAHDISNATEYFSTM